MRSLTLLTSLAAGFTLLGSASAQEPVDLPPLIPVISGPSDVAVGRTIVLDASATQGLGTETSYRWFRDTSPQPISRSVEAIYTPEEPGETLFRLVVRTVVNGEVVEAEVSKTVVVYARKMILIADPLVASEEKLLLHEQTAQESGIHLIVMEPDAPAIPLGTEEAFTRVIAENAEAFGGAEAVILWTDGIAGLQGLLRAVEDEERLSLENVTVVQITSSGLKTLARTARGPFAALAPSRIILTHREALGLLFQTENVTAFLSAIDQRDIDNVIIDRETAGLRPWNLLSTLINAMLTRGVSSQIVLLLLTLPVIATILTFLKQVVGVTTFGLFTPSIVALSFLALGWGMGVLFLLFILVTGYITRSVMRRWRLLHVPKVAIVLTVVSLTLLLLVAATSMLGITFERDTIFILLIMSTLAESFLSLKAEEGWLSALVATGETILAALICVFIVQWSVLQSLLLGYPELVLLTVVIDIGLGRWTGLRLVEYFRFREVFRHLQEE